ncbi:N-acetylglucosaminylphosphatidylinositoldeacety la se [Marasmius fiardii PR-910]|nr:N-acetylglucosaminylphosphatidylinositoldeacety la se [Marasmius fiardii PR-910]
MALPRFAIQSFLLSVIVAILYSSATSQSTFYDGSNRRNILLLTAHPDDECLFFSPTLLALRGDAELFSMCVSTGNSEGLGTIREGELHRSLDILGIKPSHRSILDHPKLQDNITVYWDLVLLSDVVKPVVVDNNIDTILTFDSQGISGHPNHKSLPNAMQHMLHTFEDSRAAPRIYSLVTVPLPIKYLGILSPIFGKVYMLGAKVVKSADLFDGASRSSVTFIAGIDEYVTALCAMRQHWSQLVWFRWLNVMFSRYMWVNDWVEVLP